MGVGWGAKALCCAQWRGITSPLVRRSRSAPARRPTLPPHATLPVHRYSRVGKRFRTLVRFVRPARRRADADAVRLVPRAACVVDLRLKRDERAHLRGNNRSRGSKVACVAGAGVVMWHSGSTRSHACEGAKLGRRSVATIRSHHRCHTHPCTPIRVHSSTQRQLCRARCCANALPPMRKLNTPSTSAPQPAAGTSRRRARGTSAERQ